VRAVLLDAGGRMVRDYGTGALVELTRTDEILEVQLGGGAGYGDPLHRPVAEVEEDLRGGCVTPAGAERDYGCVVAADGRIDLAATTALRSRHHAAG
jgi:N-methylhydantoinase B/oxoprolinase/acetone carboxylase alpha subunit